MDYYLLTLLILFCGSFTQGLTGFGSALVSLPLLVIYLDIRVAVPLCVLNGLLITSFLSLQLKSHLDWRKIGPLLLGCLPGIVVGALFLKKTSEGLFLLLLGLMLVSYALFRLFCKPRARLIKKGWGLVAGFATGAISAAFSAGGPPAIIYTTLTGWEKHEIKATLSIFFFLAGLCTAATHLLSGITTGEVFRIFVINIPATLAGVWSGSILYRRVETAGYIRLIMVALALMGLMLIKSAFR